MPALAVCLSFGNAERPSVFPAQATARLGVLTHQFTATHNLGAALFACALAKEYGSPVLVESSGPNNHQPAKLIASKIDRCRHFRFRLY